MTYERGVIRNKDFAFQERDFRGLEYGYQFSITPTDIDAFIEYQRRGYVIIEAKYGTSRLRGGQRLALERLCDDLQKIKPTLLVFSRHDCRVGEIVKFAVIPVVEYRFEQAWRSGNGFTTKALVDKFINYLHRGSH